MRDKELKLEEVAQTSWSPRANFVEQDATVSREKEVERRREVWEREALGFRGYRTEMGAPSKLRMIQAEHTRNTALKRVK